MLVIQSVNSCSLYPARGVCRSTRFFNEAQDAFGDLGNVNFHVRATRLPKKIGQRVCSTTNELVIELNEVGGLCDPTSRSPLVLDG